MPAPKKFTAKALRDAALAIVDAKGLDALTMRALVDALDTGDPLAIYNHVDGRDDLETLVAEAILADAPPLPATGRADWADAVRALAEWLWRAVRAHPNAATLLLTRRATDESTMAYAEALLAALHRSGRSGVALLAAFRAVTGFVTGFAQTHLADEADPVLELALTLPAERYPRLHEMAEATVATTHDTEFSAALEVLLAGIPPIQPQRQGDSPSPAEQTSDPGQGAPPPQTHLSQAVQSLRKGGRLLK